MKKIVLALSAFVFGAAAFAEGLSVNGYIRGGISDTTKGSVYSTSDWMGGDYFGGGAQLRLNVDYENENGGVKFRYNDDGFTNFFASGNVKYAMGYANFLDGKLIGEAGILTDRFTTSSGYEDTSFDGGKGIRLVAAPVEGLYLAAQVADKFKETYVATDDKVVDGDAKVGDIKFNEKLLAFTAKYSNEQVFVTGGVALAKKYYGSLGYTGVKGLTLAVEGIYDSTDATKNDNNDNAETTLVFWAEYTGVEKLTLGVDSYVVLSKDSNDDSVTDITITPAVSYDVTDKLSAALDTTIVIPGDENADPYATITPSVTVKASEKASAVIYGTISTDTDYVSHKVGAGLKYAF